GHSGKFGGSGGVKLRLHKTSDDLGCLLLRDAHLHDGVTMFSYERDRPTGSARDALHGDVQYFGAGGGVDEISDGPAQALEALHQPEADTDRKGVAEDLAQGDALLVRQPTDPVKVAHVRLVV